MRSLPDSKQAVRSAARRLGAWTRRPFDTGYRWGLPLALYAGLCLALPAGAGLALFLPPALALAVKAVRVSQRIHRLDFVRLVDENGTARLDTETDRLQRAWVLGCIALVGLSAALLVSRAALALLPGAELSGSIALYLGFAAVLLGGFLLLYYVALRFDNGLARGLASIAVTLPAFFVIVAVLGMALSWISTLAGSIRRDDGSPLVSDETLAAGAERDGLLPLRFRNYGTQVRTSGGGAHGSSWFYDADPADNAIQFVEMMTQDQPLKPGTASVKFQDLSVYTDNDYRTSETLAEGTWRLKFDFSFEDSSISLPAGQSFTLNGMDATLDGVTLSPLSIQVDYTVHQELAWSEDRESGQINAHDREQSYRYFESLPVVITYTDGTTQDLTNAGGGITPGDGETVCQKSRIFDELRPLDEVASVTVGDIVLPVSAG